jgi:hypothetical protein
MPAPHFTLEAESEGSAQAATASSDVYAISAGERRALDVQLELAGISESVRLICLRGCPR